ncbi:hypothetical protein AALA69_07680 [Eggerthellaceae bacterium 24-137]
MAEYIVRVDESRKATDHPKDPVAWLYALPVLEEVVRCRDCRHCDIGACFVRSQHPVLVPEDGFCHLGERARIHQIERNGQ